MEAPGPVSPARFPLPSSRVPQLCPLVLRRTEPQFAHLSGGTHTTVPHHQEPGTQTSTWTPENKDGHHLLVPSTNNLTSVKFFKPHGKSTKWRPLSGQETKVQRG